MRIMPRVCTSVLSFFSASMASVFPVACLQQTNRWWLLPSHISRFKALSDLYENDLPSPQYLESELHSWQIKWRRELEDHGESSLPTGLTHVETQVPFIQTSQLLSKSSAH